MATWLSFRPPASHRKSWPNGTSDAAVALPGGGSGGRHEARKADEADGMTPENNRRVLPDDPGVRVHTSHNASSYGV